MRSFARSVFFALVTVCAGARLFAQDAAPEPTSQHKLLAKEVGEWTGEMKMYMAPDAPPVTAPVVEKNTLMSNGLWLISEFESGPFQGHGVFGYDPAKKKFVGTWVDNQTMSLGLMEGTHDEKTGELIYLSQAMNPATGKMEPTKTVGKFIDENSKHFTMYMKSSSGDGWNKWMEISYKRSK
ncbi:MAG: DUF1579 domain-containing protein [Planctomycetaceae bacterium]